MEPLNHSTITHYKNLFKVLKEKYSLTNQIITKPFDKNLSYYINFLTIHKTIFNKPQHFKEILLDTNDFCNLECVYCHNGRSKSKLSIEDFKNFLLTQVASVGNFQVGCGMEPTMDKRLLEFIKIISNSHANPKNIFRLQTNGTLLHLWDVKELFSNGINNFTISIDTLDEEIHKQQRDNSDLNQILSNIELVKHNCKRALIYFITTVTSKNIHALEDLIKYAIKIKINSIELRQVYYRPQEQNFIKDHNKMKLLCVSEEEFNKVTLELIKKYGDKIYMCINDEHTIDTTHKNTTYGFESPFS